MRPHVLHWIILLSCVTQITGHVHEYGHDYEEEEEEKVVQHNRHRHVPKDKHPGKNRKVAMYDENSLDPNAIIESKFHRFRFPSRTCSQKNLLVQNVEVYGNWSDWSDCLTKHCIQVRYRTCLDNSWEQSDWCNVHSNHCISKHIVEKRSCQNKTTCNSHITAQRVANLLQTCGRRAGSQEMLKIVGGFETEPNSWPWAVRISYRISNKQSVSFCGGTLVAPHVILTAAHCLLVQNKRLPTGKLLRLDDYNSGSLYAHLGSHYRSKRTEGQQDFRITHAVLHPKYHRSLLADGDDIALIFLSTPVEITGTVQYACLPNSTTTFPPGTKCRAVGWGTTETGSKPTFDMLEHPFFNLFLTDHFDNIFYPFPLDMSQILRPPRRYTRTRRPKDFTSEALREVELETVSFDKCRKYYRSLDKHRTLCAGTDGKDTCTGDSGGGLYCQLPGTDQWVVSGVTSYGLARGCGLHPGVYTSVAGHMDWITQHLIQPIH